MSLDSFLNDFSLPGTSGLGKVSTRYYSTLQDPRAELLAPLDKGFVERQPTHRGPCVNCWCYDLRLDYCTWRGRTGIVLGWLTQLMVARCRFAVVNWPGPGLPRLSFWIIVPSFFVGSVMTGWAPYHGAAPQCEGDARSGRDSHRSVPGYRMGPDGGFKLRAICFTG